MRRLKAGVGAGWITFLLLIQLLSAPGVFGAETARAGLVVAHDDGRTAYVVVGFEGPSISAKELLDRSGLEVTEVSFGGLGAAVCAIDETGCDIAECRQRVCHGPSRDDPYWQYFIGQRDGTWLVSSLGISADTLKDGDVRAFIWSAGTPGFPAPSIDEVAAKAGSPGEDGVALSRYGPGGSIDDGDDDSSDERLPVGGLAVVGVALVIGSLVVLVRRRVS
jgi:hypothetical protein